MNIPSPFADKQTKEKRLSICNDCEHKTNVFTIQFIGKKIEGFKIGKPQCSVCTCFLDYKTELKFSECPLKKW